MDNPTESIQTKHSIAREAQGSPQKQNTLSYTPQVYVNCGRWQKSATDFVAIHKHQIVLASWGNYAGSLGGIRRRQYVKDHVFPGETESQRRARSNEARTASIARLSPGPLRDFFDNNKAAYPVESLIYPDIEELHFSDELIIIIPDCHITFFKGWCLDNFVRADVPENAEWVHSDAKDNGFPFISLEEDFRNFFNYCKSHTQKIYHIGDFLDNWHTAWMYERAYDILLACKESHTSTMTYKRFPVELLADPFHASIINKNDARYGWWKTFHNYMGVNESEITQKWNQLKPADIFAIIAWGMEPSDTTTSLPPLEFVTIKDTLEINLDDPVPAWHLGHVPLENNEFWNAVNKLKKSISPASAIDFLNNQTIESAIKAQYPLLNEAFTFFGESNYVRGNHDCLTPNEYLKSKFESYKSEETLASKFPFNDAEKFQDPNIEINAPSALGFNCGIDDCIRIEHGDAWDRANNDLNYYRFDVGTPWSDQSLLNTNWLFHAFTFLLGDNGGYHMPKGRFLSNQIESPDSLYLDLANWAGDFGLEPPADLRMEAIFSKHNNRRLVILGHTHLPKIKARRLYRDTLIGNVSTPWWLGD